MSINLEIATSVKKQVDQILTRSQSAKSGLTHRFHEEIKKDYQNSKREFVPYLNERDSMGKLLTHQTKPLQRKFTSTPSLQFLPPKVKSQKKLLKRGDKSFVPSPGIYFKPLSWVKPSFSKKKPLAKPQRKPVLEKIPSTYKLPATTRRLSRKKTPKQGYVRPKNLNNDVNEILRNNPKEIVNPEILNRVLAQTSVGSLKTKGTPQEIKEALKFSEFKISKDKVISNLRQIASDLQSYRFSSIK